MDLSPTLVEGIILFALGGLCCWLWWLKGRLEEMRDQMHELEKKLIAEYASKADLKEVVRDSLSPLKDAISELKGDLKATIAAIDGYKRWGPPE